MVWLFRIFKFIVILAAAAVVGLLIWILLSRTHSRAAISKIFLIYDSKPITASTASDIELGYLSNGSYDVLKFATISPDGNKIVASFLEKISNASFEKDPANAFRQRTLLFQNGGEPQEIQVDDLKEIRSVVFSPDSRRLALLVEKQSGGSFIVTDKGRLDQYSSYHSPVFSPDSQHLTYVARNQDHQQLVSDGTSIGDPYHYIADLSFNPKTSEVAYAAQIQTGTSTIVVGGRELGGKRYCWTRSPLFSDDGKSLSFIARDSRNDSSGCKDEFVVTDGSEGKHYSEISGLTYIGQTHDIAYFGWEDKNQFRIVFGSYVSSIYEGKGGRKPQRIEISANAKRWASRGALNGKEFIVDTGKDGAPYRLVSEPVLSDDGQNLAYWAAEDRDNWLIVNNEKFVHLLGGPDETRTSAKISFDSKGEKIIFVEFSPAAPLGSNDLDSVYIYDLKTKALLSSSPYEWVSVPKYSATLDRFVFLAMRERGLFEDGGTLVQVFK